MSSILAIIEKGNDGLFSIYTPETENTVLNGQGNTVQAAIVDLNDALKLVLESYKQNNEPVPEELSGDIRFVYKYDVASLFNYFDEINLSSFARKNGLNESLLRKYKNRLAFASEKQCKKIEYGLHRLGKELCAAAL